MKKLTNPHKKKVVSAAIGSVKAEGFKPSRTTIKNLNDYATGKITVSEMRTNTSNSVKRIAKTSK